MDERDCQETEKLAPHVKSWQEGDLTRMWTTEFPEAVKGVDAHKWTQQDAGIMTEEATRLLEEALRLPPEARAAIAGVVSWKASPSPSPGPAEP